jgi:guanosine-3',5'-bis(diphosphate) 3'-pyrophosphohydrolase
MSPIAQVENHASFLAKLALKYPPEEIELIDFAYDMAKYSHRNQVRDNGSRYFDHCRSVALILLDELGITDKNMVIAELLHDSVEDHYLLSVPRIRLVYGTDVAGLVDAMSHREGESEDEYIERITVEGVRAIICKLSDRLHNLRTILNCTPKKRARKLDETEKYYIPLARRLMKESPVVGTILFQEICKAIEEAS